MINSTLHLSYADLVEMKLSDAEDNAAVVFGDVGKNAKFIVFTSEDFAGAKDDTYYGIVTGQTVKEGKDWYVEIDVFGEGVKEYKVKGEDAVSKEDLVIFNLDGKDRVSVDSDKVATGTVEGAVYGIKDGFLEFLEDDETEEDYLKVLDDAVIYEVDGTKLKARRARDVKGGKEAKLLLDNKQVKVILLK